MHQQHPHNCPPASPPLSLSPSLLFPPREVRQQHPQDFSLKEHLVACHAAAKLNLPITKAELKELGAALAQVDRTLQQQQQAGTEAEEGSAGGGQAEREEEFKVGPCGGNGEGSWAGIQEAE